jgi:hypothetical protein
MVEKYNAIINILQWIEVPSRLGNLNAAYNGLSRAS